MQSFLQSHPAISKFADKKLSSRTATGLVDSDLTSQCLASGASGMSNGIMMPPLESMHSSVEVAESSNKFSGDQQIPVNVTLPTYGLQLCTYS